MPARTGRTVVLPTLATIVAVGLMTCASADDDRPPPLDGTYEIPTSAGAPTSPRSRTVPSPGGGPGDDEPLPDNTPPLGFAGFPEGFGGTSGDGDGFGGANGDNAGF